ncbi:MAG TPA: nucleoside hydrolase [Anaerolineales bacterium]|nr:nucleoside hydrolase [Anaerolineales bacterium]
MTKILLDTDIGTDVDDAVCLAYLLSHPDCDLLGITTVTGEAVKRASLASVVCRAAGKELPIYPGAEHPMRGEQRQAIAQQAEVLARWSHETNFPMNQAVEFLADTIRSKPNEVTLLTLGPLTNMGLLFSTHTDVADLLAGLVIMGGNFDETGPEANRIEWNVAADPPASTIIYETPVRLHRSLGLNVTQKVMMSAEQVREQFTAPILRPVLDMAEIWFTGFYPSITFHDPLAGATIFDNDLCSYQHGRVGLVDSDTQTKTTWQPGGTESPHQVAVTVDVDRYFQHFFDVVGSRDRIVSRDFLVMPGIKRKQ